MTDPLKMLEEWNRKYYSFTVLSGGNYQPGDGYYVQLKSPARTVSIGEYELLKDDPDDPDSPIFPTLGELIMEAIRLWHADTRLKRYHVLLHEKGSFPDGMASEIFFQTDTGHSCVVMEGRSEQDIRDRVRDAYTRAGRTPPDVYGTTEKALLEP